MMSVFLRSSYLLLSALRLADANTTDLVNMLTKIEEDTYTFAHKMEELILTRCDFTSDDTCSKRSYHTCDSELPLATCPGKDLAIKKCGSGNDSGCGGLFDFTTSVVSVAPEDPCNEHLPSSDRIKDGVCSTLQAEDYMKEFTANSTSYWESFGVRPPALYYGTDDGVFRIFPGHPGSCPNGMNTYDPRVRPWYIAASSGPKDVILVLDTSGSMKDYGRMKIMQQAAQKVINTLGVSDYFAVIVFNRNANLIGADNLMIRATDTNKKEMVNRINSLTPGGGTNFYSGFNLAFRTFDRSTSGGRSSECSRAILFLSDGALNDDAQKLKAHIKSQREKYTLRGESPPVLFTYSFGKGADVSVPKSIACENDGIWAKIGDGGDLAKSMGAYYKYFAYGLGDKINEDFVAWVEPYEFSSGVGLGTTASAPVYDRSVDPPVLAGVVGMDINFLALERAFEYVSGSHNEVFDTLVQRSGAVCPKLKISPCQLESLRVYGSGDDTNTDANCNKCSSAIQPLKPPVCEFYPNELWDNMRNEGLTFEERTCCDVEGEDTCTVDSLISEETMQNAVCVKGKPVGLIIGLVIGGMVVLVGGYLFIQKRRTRF